MNVGYSCLFYIFKHQCYPAFCKSDDLGLDFLRHTNMRRLSRLLVHELHVGTVYIAIFLSLRMETFQNVSRTTVRPFVRQHSAESNCCHSVNGFHHLPCAYCQISRDEVYMAGVCGHHESEGRYSE